MRRTCLRVLGHDPEEYYHLLEESKAKMLPADYRPKNQKFDNIVMFLIFLSSVLLALETPLGNPDSSLALVFAYADVVLTAVFASEMVLKIFAFGLLCSPGTHGQNYRVIHTVFECHFAI